MEEQMLNEEFQEAYLIFENNPSQENQTTLKCYESELKNCMKKRLKV